jgi:hypothetical protein
LNTFGSLERSDRRRPCRRCLRPRLAKLEEGDSDLGQSFGGGDEQGFGIAVVYSVGFAVGRQPNRSALRPDDVGDRLRRLAQQAMRFSIGPP